MTTNEFEIGNEDQLADLLAASKENDLLVEKNYLVKLFFFTFFWLIPITLFICIVDPYGVSPIQINLLGLNTHKPFRLDIDRVIKPYEVLRYQPKTIFLGTSRIQQSIDPSIFDGTHFAPAYNAAIPASKLEENFGNIEQYLKLDHHIKDIFIELFLYNFTTPQPERATKTWSEFFNSNISLLLSTDAVIDSVKTIILNQDNYKTSYSPAHIAKLGYRIPNNDFNPADTFSDDLFTRTVLGWDKAAKLQLQPSAMQALDNIVAIARRNNIKLHMLMTPNYPWDDYRLISLGYWPLLETWMRKMATYSDVVSFSQYNKFLEEPPTHSPKMIWWNDPTHFSLNMGREMMNAYLGHAEKDAPKNLMRHVTPATVESVIAERRRGALRWAATHSDFVAAFEAMKTRTDTVSGTLDTSRMILSVNGHDHPIVLGIGSILFADKQDNNLSTSGWTLDELINQRTTQLIATIGSTVVAQGFPTVIKDDMDLAFGRRFIPTHFNIQIPLNSWNGSEPIRVFALMQDGRAVQLTSEVPLINGIPVGQLGRMKKKKLFIANKSYLIINRKGGVIENLTPTSFDYSISGWAADMKAHAPVTAIVAVVNSKIVAKSLPTIYRDNLAGFPKNKPAGFLMNVPLTAEQLSSHVAANFYALLTDGTAAPLGLK